MKEREITELYNLYKEHFINRFTKNNSISRDALEIIYHESFLVLYQSICSGNIRKQDSLKAYLFGVGYKKLMQYYKQEKKFPVIAVSDIPDNIDYDDSPEWIEKQEAVWEIVSQMDDQCKQILDLCLWKRKSMTEIAELMNYSDENSAKTQKYKCKEKLTKRIKEIFCKRGWI